VRPSLVTGVSARPAGACRSARVLERKGDTSMPKPTRVVIGGVDTHGRTHHAAVIHQQGRLLADREFAADSNGYQQLHRWLGRHGIVETIRALRAARSGAIKARTAAVNQLKGLLVTAPPRYEKRWTGRPPLGWLPPAPGYGPTRPPLPTRSTASRQRCARSPSASSSSTKRSAWPTIGWPRWLAVPRLACSSCMPSASTMPGSC